MDPQYPTQLDFLSDGGVMGALIRAHDWAATSIGSPSGWPQPLRTALRLLLNTGHPMYTFWGPDHLCFYNDAFSVSIGPERHPSSLGQPGRVVWAEIWDVIGPQVEQVMAGRGATWYENQLLPITRNGRKEDVYWTYSYGPIDDPQATCQVGGVLVICTETTSSVLAEKRASAEFTQLRELFLQAPAFTTVMRGPEHRVDFVNDAHRRLFDSAGWIGKPIREAFPDIAGQGFYELLDEVYRAGKTYRSGASEVRFRQPVTGTWETRVLDFIYAPITDATGAIGGVFCEGFDVTDQLRTQSALRASEEQLRLATDAADVGLWDVDVVADKLFWPPRVKAMFGISPDVEVSMKDFYDGLHPEDRAATSAAFAAAVDPALKSLYDVEYRTVGKEDGLLRWVAAKGRGIFDSQGHCIRVIGTAIDVTHRRAIEKSLFESQAKLQDADRRKDQFLATLAHELRNPLAPIRNAGQLLLRPNIDPQRVARCGELIERQTKAMASLLDDLLEVTRISVGKLELKKADVTLLSVVQAAIEIAKPLLDSKGHHFDLQLVAPETVIHVDPVRMAQVLTNLLMNAAKYTDAGGVIGLRGSVSVGRVKFEVTDNGIGLTGGQIATLFEMFSQVRTSLGRAQGGLGIGLAVTKGLVELHGGHIEAASPGLGRGSSFRVELPEAEARNAPAPAVAPPQELRSGAGVLVLVVDDNADAADSLATLFESEGHQVAVAYDGHEAMKLAESVRPSVCFIDIGMPGLNGYELAAQLRKRAGGTSLLLVATTGWGQADDRRRSQEAGFDVHLTKPVDPQAASRLLSQRAAR